MALTNLEKVSASLGAKAILWELFSFNPPSLRLYVELCASSQFLCEILINNPGMIDDLMDSLVVDRPQPASAIQAELAELCKGAEDLAPILLSFRNKEWVRIGTRDILGREPVRDVTRELADVAEAIVAQVARDQFRRRADRFGTPRRPGDGGRSRWAIVGLGKFGGRELNYHSDLDLIFLHESDGETRGGKESVSNDQFMTEVVRRVLKALGDPAGARPSVRGRHPTPAARHIRPARGDARGLRRLLPGAGALVGAPGPDPRAGRLRDRGFRPRGRRDVPRRPDHAGRPGGPRPRSRRHASEARRDLLPARPEAGVRGPGRHRIHRPVPPARPRVEVPRGRPPQPLGCPGRAPEVGPDRTRSGRRPARRLQLPAPSRGACGSSTIAGTPTSPKTPTSSPGWPAASTTKATTARPSPPSAPTPTATRPGPATGITSSSECRRGRADLIEYEEAGRARSLGPIADNGGNPRLGCLGFIPRGRMSPPPSAGASTGRHHPQGPSQSATEMGSGVSTLAPSGAGARKVSPGRDSGPRRGSA